MDVARRLWALLEPVHCVVYFTEEARAALAGAGYRGFWMAYYALRAAPLGPVGPETATAAFYGFAPSRAARALPDAWSFAPPEQALAARSAGADAALRRVWGDAAGSGAVAEAADIAWRAACEADTEGRVLAAANQALPRPPQPHLRLWQAATTLREHRGDGHNAVLVARQVPPVQAHLLKRAAGEIDGPTLRLSRDWPERDWELASAALRARGWLGDDDQLTTAGREAKDDIEKATDAAASGPWRALGPADAERLTVLLQPLSRDIVAAGAFPVPNAIGVPGPG